MRPPPDPLRYLGAQAQGYGAGAAWASHHGDAPSATVISPEVAPANPTSSTPSSPVHLLSPFQYIPMPSHSGGLQAHPVGAYTIGGYTPSSQWTTPDTTLKTCEHLPAEVAAASGVCAGMAVSEVADGTDPAWYRVLSEQERVAVVLRCMKNCGFDSLGQFLIATFTKAEKPHPVVVGHATKFLAKKSRPGTHPIDVIRLWYKRGVSERFDTSGRPESVNLSLLPRHTRSRAQRLLPTLPEDDAQNSTRGDLMNWFFSEVVLQAVDLEVKALLDCKNGLVLPRPSQLQWSDLLSWNAETIEDLVASQVSVSCLRYVDWCLPTPSSLKRLSSLQFYRPFVSVNVHVGS